jgi:hypothetical protein
MTSILKSIVRADVITNIVYPINTIPNSPTPETPTPPYGNEQGLTYCNNVMLEFYSQDPAEAWLDQYLNGNISRASLVTRIKTLGALYARVTWGMMGLTGTTTSGSWDGFTVPFNSIAVFFVRPVWHQAHYDATVALINADNGPTGPNDISQSAVIAYFVRIKNIILNNVSSGDIVDLRVCHSSCHSNCHGSRGRR